MLQPSSGRKQRTHGKKWKKIENVYDTGPSKPTTQTRHSPSCCASALKNTCLNPQEEAGCSAAR